MTYDILAESDERLVFATDAKARRGRGVLFATTPFVVYLLTCIALVVLAAGDLSLWHRVKVVARLGALVALGLALLLFALGYRVRDVIEADRERVRIRHRPALGPERVRDLPYATLRAFGVDPSLRSLGADVLLVAIAQDGQRVPVAEGEPHSAQIRDLAAALAKRAHIPLEPPKIETGAYPPVL